MRGQLPFPGFDHKKKLAFGGAQLKSNPKTARTVVTNQAMHLVLRSSFATGARSFLLINSKVEAILKRQAELFNVRIYDAANAGNHLHLIVKVRSPRLYKSFIRAISGLLARAALKAERGSPWKGTKFWDARPFTRIVSWGQDYTRLKNYLMLNRTEMLGLSRLSVRAMLEAIKVFQRQPGLVAIGFEENTA